MKETGPYFNTAYLIDADQKILGRYHKRMLLPWGEYDVGQRYIPGLRTILGDEDGGLVPGNSARPLTMPDGTKLGVLICYEDLIDQAARESVAEGAEILLNLNNLAGFGETAAVPGHQQLARFRAIETRRALLRCGIVGSTAVISPTGRVEQQASLYRPATLTASAPLLEGSTLYIRLGDVFAKACLVLAGILLFRRAVQFRKGRNSQPGVVSRAANDEFRTLRDET
jgi:apolipoprotein N-acyltransferase